MIGVVFRSFGKLELLDTFVFHGAKRGAEIGVYNGEYSAAMLRQMPNLTLYMVDPYRFFTPDIYYDSSNDNQKIQDLRYKLVKELAKRFGDRANVLRLTSMEALHVVKDESLDFVYIDANHDYKYVKQDIKEWYKKVKVNGYVSGHDFNDNFISVKRAVIETCNENEVKTLFVGKHDDVWMFQKVKGNESG